MATKKTPAEILVTEFDEKFIEYMRNRMIFSFHKYGPLADAYPAKVDAIASLEKRLAKYKETGNAEWLVDVCNFAMIEFMRPRHPNAHFEATDSHASPGRINAAGQQTWKNNDEVG